MGSRKNAAGEWKVPDNKVLQALADTMRAMQVKSKSQSMSRVKTEPIVEGDESARGDDIATNPRGL